MEILKVISALISFIVIMLGVIMIFDARKLTKKWFSFHDQNEGSKWLKIGGFILAIIGILVLFFIF